MARPHAGIEVIEMGKLRVSLHSGEREKIKILNDYLREECKKKKDLYPRRRNNLSSICFKYKNLFNCLLVEIKLLPHICYSNKLTLLTKQPKISLVLQQDDTTTVTTCRNYYTYFLLFH